MNKTQITSWDKNELNISQQITFLPHSDCERTIQFYRDILGLKMIRDQGDCLIFEVTKSAYLGFCLRMVISEPGKIILTLVSQQIDNWYAHLSRQTLETLGPPQYNPKYGIYHFFLVDPNGYKIEIQCFDNPLM